jgi:hypothetical protein
MPLKTDACRPPAAAGAKAGGKTGGKTGGKMDCGKNVIPETKWCFSRRGGKRLTQWIPGRLWCWYHARRRPVMPQERGAPLRRHTERDRSQLPIDRRAWAY